jgi:hypothetical protein
MRSVRSILRTPIPPKLNAKLWIIGRTYATQIERIVSSSGLPMQGSLMGKSLARVAKLILSRGTQLDGLFATLRTVHEPLLDAQLRQILDVHGKFVGMLTTLTKGKSATTFAAKYLHFHNPVAPIYDNLAAGTITKIVERQSLPLWLSGQSHYDPNYVWYLERFWALYSEVASNPKLPLKVKYVDAYLAQ